MVYLTVCEYILQKLETLGTNIDVRVHSRSNINIVTFE